MLFFKEIVVLQENEDYSDREHQVQDYYHIIVDLTCERSLNAFKNEFHIVLILSIGLSLQLVIIRMMFQITKRPNAVRKHTASAETDSLNGSAK